MISVSDNIVLEILFIDEYVSEYIDGDEIYIDCGEYGRIIVLVYVVCVYDDCSEEIEVDFIYEDFGLFSCVEFGYLGYLIISWSSIDDCGNISILMLNWYLIDNIVFIF